MEFAYLMTLTWTAGALAGPVKRDCEQTCFNTTNGCGVAFGGCWKECEGQRPTFTAPLCPATIAEALGTATATKNSIPGSETTLITFAPGVTVPPTIIVSNSATPTVGCNSGTTVCIDYLATCGNRQYMYGGCDDICSSVSYTAPACTVSAVTDTIWPGTGSRTMPTKTKAKRPPTTRTPCKSDKSWMCAPAEW